MARITGCTAEELLARGFSQRTEAASWQPRGAAGWPGRSASAWPPGSTSATAAGRTDPVGHRWVKLAIGPGLTATSIREDRILNEAHTSGGDQRRLADLFGLSIEAVTRYIATLDHPYLASGPR